MAEKPTVEQLRAEVTRIDNNLIDRFSSDVRDLISGLPPNERKTETDSLLDAIYDEDLISSVGPTSLTKDKLLSIDFRKYQELETYPASGENWNLERKKLLFARAAVDAGVPWRRVAHMTKPFFGSLSQPPEAYSADIIFSPFTPPPFDVARQKPSDWLKSADKAWEAYRTQALEIVELQKQGLVEFEKGRRSSGIAGQKKTSIEDEVTRYQWASLRFLEGLTWDAIAAQYPLQNVALKRRSDQVKKAGLKILDDLGLPVK